MSASFDYQLYWPLLILTLVSVASTWYKGFKIFSTRYFFCFSLLQNALFILEFETQRHWENPRRSIFRNLVSVKFTEISHESFVFIFELKRLREGIKESGMIIRQERNYWPPVKSKTCDISAPCWNWCLKLNVYSP